MSDHEEKAEERAERAGSMISEADKANGHNPPENRAEALAQLATAEAVLSVGQRLARLAELLEQRDAVPDVRAMTTVEELEELAPETRAALVGLLVRTMHRAELEQLLIAAGADLEPAADEYGLADGRPLAGFTKAELAVMPEEELKARKKRAKETGR